MREKIEKVMADYLKRGGAEILFGDKSPNKMIFTKDKQVYCGYVMFDDDKASFILASRPGYTIEAEYGDNTLFDVLDKVLTIINVPQLKVGGSKFNKKNNRRFELIDKKIDHGLTDEETVELGNLQSEIISTTKRKHPLPSIKKVK